MSNIEIKGFSFAYGSRRGELGSEQARHSLDLLAKTGTKWIALCIEQLVARKDSQEIRFNYNRNVTDVEIIQFVAYAHSIGMKVCLKPMINCMDGTWRAFINFWDDEGSWAKWFYEYTGYLTHMAEVAEFTGCEMLCLGCEMLGMERHEAHWRELIAKVRKVYHGPLTYNTNHGHELDAKWYDALDYVGTSAYFRMKKIGGNPGPIDPAHPIMDLTKEDMLASWKEVKEQMREVHEKLQKPILFMEIGCRSARGTACQPWDFSQRHLPFDEEEQALFYETALETFSDCDFMKGFFWWDWSVHVHEDRVRPKDTGFAIFGKKAEQVLKLYYEEK